MNVNCLLSLGKNIEEKTNNDNDEKKNKNIEG